MKRHVAAVLALVITVAVIDSHVDWVRQDDQALLEVNGQRFDLNGWVSEQWRQWRNDCSATPWLPMNNPSAEAMLAPIRTHSLPDSRSARPLQLRQWGEWAVAEVAFDTLNTSLVVLRLQGGQWRVQDQAVWSGSTAPWHSAAFVRRYLRQQATELPDALLNCLEVDPLRYGVVQDRASP